MNSGTDIELSSNRVGILQIVFQAELHTCGKPLETFLILSQGFFAATNLKAYTIGQ